MSDSGVLLSDEWLGFSSQAGNKDYKNEFMDSLI